MLLQLIQGAALLLALCFLHSASIRLWRGRPLIGKAFSGVFFGIVCVVGMLSPVVLMPGVIFDGRSVVLSMAGLFGGPIVAGIAAAMSVLWRLSIGGAGAGVGLLIIALSTGLGLAYRWGRGRDLLNVKPGSLLLFGLLLNLMQVACLQFLPDEIAQVFNRTLIVPVVMTFTLATALMGWILRDAEIRLTTEQALTESAARLRAITQALPDLVMLLDEQGRYVEVLTGGALTLAARSKEVLGKRLHEVLPQHEAEQFQDLISRTLRSGQTESFDYAMQVPSGLRHFESRTQPLGIPVNGRAAVVFVARDVTNRVHSETALRESEIRFRLLLRDIPSISVQGYRADGTTSYWNKASETLYGYSEQEALGKSLLDLIIPPVMRNGVSDAMQQLFTHGTPIPSGEMQLQRKDGSPVDVFSSHTRINVPGHPAEMFCIDIDISGRKSAEKEARYLALYDALTGLPNRRLLMDRMGQVMANSARSGLHAALLFVDLDNFKTLNDSRGHAIGDMLLREVAQRLQHGVREHDTVARLGGDEFVVVVQNLNSDTEAAAVEVRQLGESLLAQLREPYVLSDQQHRVTASMGISVICDHKESIDELLKQADMAMYRAKDAGRNTLYFFDPDMQHVVNLRAMLEAELHTGLQQAQFFLFYQPQVDSVGRVTGAEALVRWQHPDKGMVAPSVFIPLAEESGLILPLGHWVMETAMRQQARWRDDPALAPLHLAINVSARQFRQADFVQQVLALLQSTGADATRITLELTESMLLYDVDSVIATMLALKAHGLSFSLDDFGTGYSSLSYLKRLPLDQIKIDQGFVRDILHNASDAAIAQSIITLSGALGLRVIAEGVETEAHHAALQAHGCRAFQGYLFGRPESLAAFELRARSTGPLPAAA